MSSQEEISRVCDAVKEMLLEKNRKYADSAIRPAVVISHLTARDGIILRAQDKLNRLHNYGWNGPDVGNDVGDLVGYLILLMVVDGSSPAGGQ